MHTYIYVQYIDKCMYVYTVHVYTLCTQIPSSLQVLYIYNINLSFCESLKIDKLTNPGKLEIYTVCTLCLQIRTPCCKQHLSTLIAVPWIEIWHVSAFPCRESQFQPENWASVCKYVQCMVCMYCTYVGFLNAHAPSGTKGSIQQKIWKLHFNKT